MKTVHNSKMVAHLWANQSQSEARNAGGSFFFRNSTIFSYGSHFPIAKVIAPKVVLFTTKSYSTTTCKHLSHTRRAIASDVTVWKVPNVLAETQAEHLANLAALRETFIELQNKLVRARSYGELYLKDIEQVIETHNAYRAHFRLKCASKELMLEQDWEYLAKIRLAEQAVKDKAKREAQAKLNEQIQKQKLENLHAWMHKRPLPHAAYGVNGSELPIQIRLKDEHTVETSRGAELPVMHCRKLWQEVYLIKNGDKPEYQHNGHSLHAGSFVVECIKKDGSLKAGCHYMTYEAMKSFADRMNWPVYVIS